MYKLIIVDDEKAIRKGIRDYFDWEQMGFEVAGLFEDGKEALAYIADHEVDVVLTDIEMAEVSGISLARSVWEHRLPVKVVIISGYKEFEYARQAIRYNVEHYLLKPISTDEIREVFGRVYQDLEREQQTRHNRDLSEILPELTEQFWITALAGGESGKEKVRRRLRLLNLPVTDTFPAAVIRLQISSGDHGALPPEHQEGEGLRNLVYNICGGEMEHSYNYPVFLSDREVKIVMAAREQVSPAVFREQLQQEINERCEMAERLLTIRLELEIEEIYSDIYQLSSYRGIFTQRHSDSGESGETVQLSAGEKERLGQKYKLIIETINDGRYEELNELIEAVFHECRDISDIKVKHLFVDMFSMVTGRLIKMGADIHDVTGRISYQEILNAGDRAALKRIVTDGFAMIADKLRDRQNPGSKYLVEEAIRYMKSHYGDEISLEIMAGKVYLNQAYFSRIFKQYTGATFTDYLIELRMEKAKELLMTGSYRVYEVSTLVGYRSEKSFFRVFKQYTGQSPSEYYRGMSIHEKEKAEE